jgi:multidrug resistance efflux pump
VSPYDLEINFPDGIFLITDEAMQEVQTMRIQKSYLVILILILMGALLATACTGQAQEATPDVVPEFDDAFASIVSATGIVVPERWSTISMQTSGVVEELYVVEGEQVDAGQLLLVLAGSEQLHAALSTAELEYVNAQKALDELYEGAELARAQVVLELANALDALDDAEYRQWVQQEGNRASSERIAEAEANLALAQDKVDKAADEYNKYSGRAVDDPVRALARSNLAAARQQRDSILRQLNWYTGYPDEIEQGILDADVIYAEARVAEAERQLEKLQDGPDPDALELAQARLDNAEVQVSAARAALTDLELSAPFAGTVTRLYLRPNEWLIPGQPVLLLADLAKMYVETTDLNEIDVARVQVGDTVIVTFDALPEVVVNGIVTRIADKASEGSGVNYTVLIELDEIPADVRWDMTAFVDIEVGSEN